MVVVVDGQMSVGKKMRKWVRQILFINRGMKETPTFTNLASEMYLLFCHFLLFQLEWEIYKTYSLTIGLVHFTLINFNVMMNRL